MYGVHCHLWWHIVYLCWWCVAVEYFSQCSYRTTVIALLPCFQYELGHYHIGTGMYALHCRILSWKVPSSSVSVLRWMPLVITLSFNTAWNIPLIMRTMVYESLRVLCDSYHQTNILRGLDSVFLNMTVHVYVNLIREWCGWQNIRDLFKPRSLLVILKNITYRLSVSR
jgi:hypothetical protein